MKQMPLNDSAIDRGPIQGRPMQQDPIQQFIQFLSHALQGGGMAVGDAVGNVMTPLFSPSPQDQQMHEQRFQQGIGQADQNIAQNAQGLQRLRDIFAQPLASAPNPRTYQPGPTPQMSAQQLFPSPQQAQGPQQNYLDSLFLPPKPQQQAQAQPRPAQPKPTMGSQLNPPRLQQY